MTQKKKISYVMHNLKKKNNEKRNQEVNMAPTDWKNPGNPKNSKKSEFWKPLPLRELEREQHSGMWGF